MSQENFISLFLLAVLLWVLYVILKILAPFFAPMFWAAVLAFAFYPLYKKVRPDFRSHESLAATFMTCAILLFIVPIVGMILFQLGEETVRLSQGISEALQRGALQRQVQKLLSQPWMHELETSFFRTQDVWRSIKQWLLDISAAAGSFTVAQALSLTKNVFQTFFNLALIVIILFFFLRDGEKIHSFIFDLIPLETRSKEEVFGQVEDTLKSVIHGQLLIALVKAVLTGGTLWMMALPFPILFGAICFFVSLLPVVGAWLIWFPFVLYLAAQAAYVKAVFLFIIGVLIIGTADNILYPFLIGKKTKLPFLLLLLSVMGGLTVYGMEGIFIGPAVISLFFVLVKIYRLRFLDSQSVVASS